MDDKAKVVRSTSFRRGSQNRREHTVAQPLPYGREQLCGNRSAPARGRRLNEWALIVSLLFCPSVSSLHAQAIDPPVTRPLDFSEIVGAYRIQSSIAVEEVRVEQPFLLKVIVQGNGPPKYHPRLEKLKVFPPDMDAQFFVEPVPEKTRAFPEKDFWEFVYRLRPKSEEVTHIPGLKLVMYHPARRKFQPSYADPIALTVKPAQEKEITLDLKVVRAPESFYEVRALSPSFPWRVWLIGAMLFGTPAVYVLRYLLWRRSHPHGASQLARRRSRAARKAMGLLVSATEPGEVSATAASYLRDRLDFPTQEATAPEVRHFLLRRGLAKDVATQWSVLFDRCAHQRFGEPGHPLQARLNQEAMTLIQNLEEQPCLSV